MSFKTVDVLNTVRDTFSGEKIRNKIKKEPLIEELVKLDGIVKQQGGGYNRVSHLVGVDSGVRGQAMISGMEQTERKARQISEKTLVSPTALIADLVLTKMEQELLKQTGSPLEKKAEDLLNNAVAFAMQDIASRFISGESTGHIWSTAAMKNVLTLNGQKSDGTFDGNTNGLLSFDSVANQIGSSAVSVMNLTRRADIHFNQSEALSVGGELFDKMQRAYLAAQRADAVYNGPQIGFCDIATYIKIFSERRDLVRIGKDTDDVTSKDFRIAEFGPMRITYSDYIDLTNYTSHSGDYDPSNGFITMLNTNYLCYWTLKGGKMFDLGKWMDATASGQRIFVAPLDLHGNFELLNLPAHANVSNTLA